MPGVSPRASLKSRVFKESHGVSRGSLGPRAPECPKTLRLRVSPECLDTFLTLRNTLGTLFGHSRAWGPKGPATPHGTLPPTPPFSGTLSGTLPGTLWARSAQKTPVGGPALRITATEINFPRGPICQKLRYGNHSSPL